MRVILLIVILFQECDASGNESGYICQNGVFLKNYAPKITLLKFFLLDHSMFFADKDLRPYTPMDYTPLHSIPSVCHPWGRLLSLEGVNKTFIFWMEWLNLIIRGATKTRPLDMST